MRTGVVWIFAALLAASIAAQQHPRFEVASVKRSESFKVSTAIVPRAFPGGRFAADFATVESLLWFAYGVRQDLIAGGPDCVRQDRFEISARCGSWRWFVPDPTERWVPALSPWTSVVRRL